MALPTVLAGPILQRVEEKRIVVWLVTSTQLDPKKLAAEVWDPLPSGISGFVPEPGKGNPPIGSLQAAQDLEVRQVGPTLYVHRISVRSQQPWPRNRALAYRIAPTGTDWIRGAKVEPLPGNPRAMVARGAPASGARFQYPWFAVDPLDQNWGVLSLQGRAPDTWIAAEGYIERLCTGTKTTSAINRKGPNIDVRRPTTALMFAADMMLSDPALVGVLVNQIAAGVAVPLATFLAHYLLASSPTCWDLVAAAIAPKPLPAGVVDRAKAFAAIGAHVPLFAIPSLLYTDEYARMFALPGRALDEAAQQAFGLCFGWGNVGEQPAPPGVGDLSEATHYETGCAPRVQIWFSRPPAIEHRDASKGPKKVFPQVVVATPEPLFPLSPELRTRLPALGAFDNLFALSSDGEAYVATPPDQVDDTRVIHVADARSNPSYLSGLPARRIYQQGVTADTSSSPPKQPRTGHPIQWNARSLTYDDAKGSTPVLLAKPAFGALTAEPGAAKPGYRIAVFEDVDHGIGITLERIGHRVMPVATAGVFLGNRFRKAGNGSDPDIHGNGQMGGIIVSLGTQTFPSQSDGSLPGLLAALKPGRNTITIGGPLTQPDPPGPALAPRQSRMWRQRSFELLVADGRVIQVDEESVGAQGVRLLIDPVYMELVSGVRLGTPARPNPVQLVILHRTEGADAAGTLDVWMTPMAQRYANGLRDFMARKKRPPTAKENTKLQEAANVAAPYILARDGTLIKTAHDATVVIHAGGAWGPTSRDTNNQAVGVEISKLHDELSPYTEAQYAHISWLLGEYCNSGVDPLAVVGHGDVKHVGKDDPGLHFEWSRLEAQGFGIRKPGPLEGAPAPVIIKPLPALPDEVTLDFADPSAQQYRTFYGAAWDDLQRDLRLYKTLFATELKPGGSKATANVIATVRTALKSIGYHQDLDPANYSGGKLKKDIASAVESFRSRMFSGARRMLFALRPAGAEERLVLQEEHILDDDEILFQLTAVWAKLVADFVTSPSAKRGKPPPQPMPDPPR